MISVDIFKFIMYEFVDPFCAAGSTDTTQKDEWLSLRHDKIRYSSHIGLFYSNQYQLFMEYNVGRRVVFDSRDVDTFEGE